MGGVILMGEISGYSVSQGPVKWRYGLNVGGWTFASFPGAVVVGQPAGGDKGVGSINAEALYVGGVAVGAGSSPGGASGALQYNNAGAFGGVTNVTSAGATLAFTAAIGTTPFTVTSTTLVANLNVAALNGATFAAPGTIGGTAPGIGTFLALAATTGTFSGLLQGLGTATNNNATAGQIGEYITASVAVGSAVPLTTQVSANIASISLTAGDWDVSGVVCYNIGAGDTQASAFQKISTTSADPFTTIGLTDTSCWRGSIVGAITQGLALPISTTRLSLAGTTTVFLVANAGHSGGTLSGYGQIAARRSR